MSYRLSELVDVDKYQKVLADYCEAVGIGAAIIDLEGNILAASHWQPICTEFHRINPHTHERCIESDTHLANILQQEKRYALYRCLNGITTSAAPIFIEEEHVANAFAAQFFLEPPDREFFRKQAQEYGFNEEDYMEALTHVPIMDEKKLPIILEFLTSFAEMMGTMGLNAKRQMEVEKALRDSEERWKFALEGAGDGIWDWNAQTNETFFSRQWKAMLGYEEHEIVNTLGGWDNLVHPEDKEQAYADIHKHLSGQTPTYVSEYRLLCKDGSYKWILDRGKVISWTDDGKPLRIIGTHTDITERKRVEEQLRESTEQARLLFETTNQGIVYLDAEGQIEYINPANEKIIGASLEEQKQIASTNINPKIINEDGTPCSFEEIPHFKALRTGKRVSKILGITNVRDHTLHWIDGESVPLFRPGEDKPYRVYNIFSDITERIRAEEALRESEKKYRTLHDSMRDAFARVDMTGRIIEFNHSFQEMLGYSEEELKRLTYKDITPEKWHDFEAQIFEEQIIVQGFSKVYEKEYRHKDGTIFPVELRTILIRNDADEPVGMWATIRDITERKRIEAELLYNKIAVDQSREAIHWVGTGGELIYVNEAMCQSLGYTKAELLNLKVFDFAPRFFPETWQEHWEKSRGLKTFTVETEYKTKDGRIFPVEISISHIEYQGKEYHCSIARDITERKRAQEALQNSKAFLDTIINLSPTPTWISDSQGTLIRSNQALRELLQITDEDVVGKYNIFQDELVIEQGFVPLVQKVFEQGHRVNFVIYWDSDRLQSTLFPKRVFVILDVTISPVKDAEGRVTNAIIQHQDITQRVRAEEALRESNEKLQAIIQASPVAISVLNAEGKVTLWNPAAEQIYGWKQEEIIGQYLPYVTQDKWEEHLALRERVFRGETLMGIEVRRQKKDGSPIDINISAAPIHNADGAIIGTMNLSFDITEHKRAEEALRENEKKYRSLYQQFQGVLNAIPDAMCLLTPDLKIVWANEAKSMGAHVSISEMIGQYCYPLQHGRTKPCEICPVIRCFHSGKLETDVSESFGLYYELRAVPIYDDQGKLWGAIEVARNITDRLKAEEALRESEERLRMALEAANQGYFDFNVQTLRDETVSPEYVKILEYTPEEFKDQFPDWVERTHPDDRDRVMENLRAYIHEEIPTYSIEYRQRTKSGKWKWIHSQGKIVSRDEHGKPLRMMGIRTDITERKQAEKALQESETKYRSLYLQFQGILDAMPDIVCLLSPDLRFVWGNQATASGIYKNDVAEIIGQCCFPLRHERTEPCEGCPVLRSFQTGKMETAEVISFDMDWELRALPLYDDQGKLQGAIEIARNITEQKRMIEALRESEQRFAAFMRHLPGLAIVKNHERRILYLNERHTTEYGISPADWIGKTHEEIWPGELGIKIQQNDETVLSENRTLITFAEEKKHDELRYYQSILFPIPRPNQPSWLGSITIDITDLKRAEQAVRESEERYRRLIELSPDTIFIQSEGKIVFINTAGWQMLGAQSPDEIIGRDVNQFVHPDYHEIIWERVRYMSDSQLPAPPLVEKYVRLDGSIVDVEATATSFVYHGKPSTLVMIRDITERIKLEEQLRQSLKMEAIGKLAGGVAHDFNNLLTAILGYSDILLKRINPRDTIYKEINEIRKAGERAASLTQQLLAFSRKQILEPKVLNLNEMIVNIQKMLRRLIGEDIELITFPEAALGKVKADPNQLEQILLNLAVNARDAMPHGGKLTLETKNVILSDEYAREHPDVQPGSYVMLAVSDTGCGMDDETRRRIFEPFYTTKEKGKGTGLGLSTVYGIVKQSGGHIFVYSEIQRGSTFKIYLPRIEEHGEIAELKDFMPPILEGNETILLVEDDVLVRSLVFEALQESGYRVLIAGHPAEALKIEHNHEGTIDLLISDVIMPQMSGKKLADMIVYSRPQIRVLFMSGYTDNAIVHHGVLEEGTNFIQKPFAPDELLAKVRHILDAK